jgi:Xaa-Pro aminopeptidase
VNPRIRKLISSFAPAQIDCLLVTKDINISYLTQFPSRESWLLVSSSKTIYITDSRYILEVRKKLKEGITIRRYTASLAETLFGVAQETGVRRIGFDSQHVTLSQYKSLRRKCPPSVRLVQADNLVENLREIKEPQEIQKIRHALTIHRQAHQFLKRTLRAGLTEEDVLCRLERFVKSRGAQFSFEPIIASGPNSCYPHARVTGRRIRRSDLVLVDMGIDVNGYKSDLTRIFFLGRIPRFIQEVYLSVAAAQRKAMDVIMPGASVRDVDCAARNYLAKMKLARYFTHVLGHGVGLEIHECPRLSQKSSSILREGMIITIEPAVYIPNKFGIRIEDMVLVTKKGCEVLSDNIH